MKGEVCIVIGSNPRMIKETALVLANMCITVVMVVSNPEHGEKALAEIINKN